MDEWAARKAEFAAKRQAAQVWTEFEPGDIIGYRKSGAPIYMVVGGAADNFDDWIPEETDSAVIQRVRQVRSEEHTSELQSLMRSSYAVFCLHKKTKQ